MTQKLHDECQLQRNQMVTDVLHSGKAMIPERDPRKAGQDA